MNKVIFRMLIGALAALLAWAIFEPTRPSQIPAADPDAWQTFETHLILAWGVFIGLAVAGYNGYLQGSKIAVLRGVILGALFGGVGATFGYHMGDVLVRVVFGAPFEQVQVTKGLATAVIARWVALTPLGTFIGVAIGASTFDWRRALHGAIGGTIGAAIGAVLFDTLGSMVGTAVIVSEGIQPGQTGEVGQIPRAIFALSMGSMIALFIGLVEQLARQAWVRQALGRNEGREWPLYGHRSMIGRNELAQIPLFGDPAVAPVHAFIDRQGRDYWLADGGSGAPTLLNGQPVTAAPLAHGAHIQVGNTVLQFLLKGAAAAPAGYSMPVPVQAGMPQPMPVPEPYPRAPQPSQNLQQMPFQPAPAQPTTVVATPVQPPTLVAIDGPLAGQRYPITGLLEIGREAAGLILGFDTSVSRRHASLTPSPSGLILQDLGSTNGTFLNGQRITSATINPGDLVRIGATTFRLE